MEEKSWTESGLFDLVMVIIFGASIYLSQFYLERKAEGLEERIKVLEFELQASHSTTRATEEEDGQADDSD